MGFAWSTTHLVRLPGRFLYVVYTTFWTTDYHGIVSPTSSRHPSRPSSHLVAPLAIPPCRTVCNVLAFLPRRFCDENIGDAFHVWGISTEGTSQWAVQDGRRVLNTTYSTVKGTRCRGRAVAATVNQSPYRNTISLRVLGIGDKQNLRQKTQPGNLNASPQKTKRYQHLRIPTTS